MLNISLYTSVPSTVSPFLPHIFSLEIQIFLRTSHCYLFPLCIACNTFQTRGYGICKKKKKIILETSH